MEKDVVNRRVRRSSMRRQLMEFKEKKTIIESESRRELEIRTLTICDDLHALSLQCSKTTERGLVVFHEREKNNTTTTLMENLWKRRWRSKGNQEEEWKNDALDEEETSSEESPDEVLDEERGFVQVKLNEDNNRLQESKLNGSSSSRRHSCANIAYRGKIHDKRDFLFRDVPVQFRREIQVDDVALFSVTDMKSAARMTKLALSLPGLTNNSIMTDATACVGGNTRSFCEYFQHVNAVECDRDRYDMLVHNMQSVFNYHNVSYYCASYLDIMQTLIQDVVFFDPPWGGPNYFQENNLALYLDNISLSTICEAIKKRTKYVIIKVPINFGFSAFQEQVTGRVQVHANYRKMSLVVVDYVSRSRNKM